MDLCESQNRIIKRHPWELSRLKALKFLLKMIPNHKSDFKVLDVGCGDGFIGRELFKEIRFKLLTGIDTRLSDQKIVELSKMGNGIFYSNSYGNLETKSYNLALLLDVIEHVKNDKTFILDIVNNYLAVGGYILIMAPAFQFIFSSHDRFLGHYRRYSRKGLLAIINTANLHCLASGYLFISLLPIRAFLAWCERFVQEEKKRNKGIGAWSHGKIITTAIELILGAENRLSIVFNKFGFRIPGLTVWTLCKKLQ